MSNFSSARESFLLMAEAVDKNDFHIAVPTGSDVRISESPLFRCPKFCHRSNAHSLPPQVLALSPKPYNPSTKVIFWIMVSVGV